MNTNTPEMLDLYDQWGQKTGQSKERMEVLKNGDLHASVHLWFIDQKHNILLQKRSLNKKTYPGRYVAAVSGHISSNENVKQTLIKEAKEEMGINLIVSEVVLKAILQVKAFIPDVNLIENELINIFISRSCPDFNVEINNDEVELFKWFSFAEFQTLVNEHYDFLVPVKEEYKLIIEYIKTL